MTLFKQFNWLSGMVSETRQHRFASASESEDYTSGSDSDQRMGPNFHFERVGATEPQQDHRLAMSHGGRYKHIGGRQSLLSLIYLEAISEETTGYIDLNFFISTSMSSSYIYVMR